MEVDNQKWIAKEFLRSYIYNAIRDFGLPYVLECVEASVEHQSMGLDEWMKEFNLVDMFAKKELKKSKTEYTGKLTISQLAEKRYGLEIDSNKRCACPLHKGENKTSFLFNDETNTFKCFSCGESGNLIHFIKRMEELGYGG